MSWAMTERDYSQRRACALVGMAPKTYRPGQAGSNLSLRTVYKVRCRAL